MSGAKKRRINSYDDVSGSESDCEITSTSSSQESILSTSSSLEQEMEKFRAPVASILELIARAIMESPSKMLYLLEIYDNFESKYPYFQVADLAWRSSVRHNLSMHACFVKVARCDVRKGYFWGIHPANLSDFSSGDFTRRRVKSRVQEYEKTKAQSLSLTSPLHHYGNGSLSGRTVTSPTLPLPPRMSLPLPPRISLPLPPRMSFPLPPRMSFPPPPQMSFPNLIQSPLMQALSSPWGQPLRHQPILRPILPSPLQWMPSSPVTIPPPSLLTPRPPLTFQFPSVPYMMSLKPANQLLN